MFARLPARPNRRARRIRGRVALAATVAAIASLGLIAAPDPSRAQRVATETPPPPPAAKKPAKATKSAGKEAAVAPGSGQAVMVVVLVNDEPITNHQIEQRQRLLGLSAQLGDKAQAAFKALIANPAINDKLKAILNDTIKSNPGKSREQIIAIFEQKKKDFGASLQKQAVENARASVLPGLRKNAMDELIEEALKLQEAKSLTVVAGDEDVERILKGMAERNKMTVEQFGAHLQTMGVDIASMRARFKAMLSWNDVIRRRFGHQIAISERDIDRAVATAPASAGTDDQVELQLQRITLPIAAKLDQKIVDKKFIEAEGARAKFAGCKSAAAFASGLGGARFEDLGARKPSTIPDATTRGLLLNAKDGEMLPAVMGQGGIELWVVCGRTALKADEAKRAAVQDGLRQQEFERMAKGYMQDLRQRASIVYR